MNDHGFEASLQRMRELLAAWPRRAGRERAVSGSWLESQIRVHESLSSVRVPGGRQDPQTIAENEFILEGLRQGELRVPSRHSQGGLWEIIRLTVTA